MVPWPEYHELAYYNTSRAKLDDASTDDLSDLAAIGTAVGPDDVTWAFEWEVRIAGNGTFQISKDNSITSVPEPGTITLVALGLGAAAFVGRRRRR